MVLLTTSIKELDKEKWEKLKRVMAYINVTINISLVLKEYSLSIVKFWVDGSFRVHLYIGGNT